MNEPKYTPDDIRSLAPNEVFVFGSNTEGRHGKGAAKFAMQKFGAKWGDAEGMTGRCYALPTVEARLRKMSLPRIYQFVRRFKLYAATRPELTFLVTQVGCGLAGHKVRDIAPMFKDAPQNCILPEVFHSNQATPPRAD